MLHRNADAFFTTPIPTSIIRGGNMGRPQMPEPRAMSASATSLQFVGETPSTSGEKTSKVPLLAIGIAGLAVLVACKWLR